MLVFTNRLLSDATDASAFETRYEPGSSRLGMATVTGAAGQWAVSGIDHDVDDADSLHALLPLFQGPRPVLVYLHGNNNTPAKCFERCARLASMYDVEVIGFSWPSEGYLADGRTLPGVSPATADGDESDLAGVREGNRKEPLVQSKIWRYHQAKTNAQNATDALARFLRMLGTARLYADAQPFTLAAHSLGAHLLQYTLDVSGAGEAVATAQNVALLAPCVRASGHSDWLAKLRPKSQVFVTYNQADTVLFGACLADGNQLKLGAGPAGDLLRAPSARYVSFTHGEVGAFGHGYFVNDGMPKKMRKFFKRIFRSGRDIEAGEYPRQVYLVGCDEDGLTCYMGAPDLGL